MTSPNPTDLPEGDATTLDRRRDKAQGAKDTADKARDNVADLDARIATNAGQAQRDQAALHQAQDEVTRLKRALKTAAKEDAVLQTRRKKASTAAVKAEVKAKAAEAKYDQAVLADMVRREKARDRSAAAATAKVDAPPADTTSVAPSPGTTSVAPSAGTTSVAPSAQQPTARPGTATRTAPRRTAAKAPEMTTGNGTPNAS
jgi:multidrug resistance efflux pump